MKNLLFLVHRIPYPPNKGDKIRSYHLLRYLADEYRIFLGTFVDNSEDWRYVKDVQSFCAESCFLPLDPQWAKLRSLRGFFLGQALSLPYYHDSRMQNWVHRVVDLHGIDTVLVFSSAMTQFIDARRFTTKVIDFVDVDSDKWLQYAKGKPWPGSWIYRREGRLLLEFDRQVANDFDVSIFVSSLEAKLFKGLVPEVGERITHIDNGVDTQYFSPEHDVINPYPEDEVPLVFTGAMDYWANVDAVTWFAREVFPRIYNQFSNSRFYIVGGNPSEAVRNLSRLEGVTVTGTVEDVRPFIKYGRVSVAPLRIARGIQNKVLEAMAMGKPILATSAAMEGIRISSILQITVTDSAKDMAENGLELLNGNRLQRVYEKNREWVIDHYSWGKNMEKLGRHLQ